MKVKSESEVAQSCPTPSDPMDCSLPGFSVHGIFQARVLEWGPIAFSIILITSSLLCFLGGGEEIVGLRSSRQARSERKIWNSEESLEFGE